MACTCATVSYTHLLDAIVGRDPANPEEASEVPEMEAQGYYRVLSLATVPLLLGMLVWSGWILAHRCV